MLVFHFSHVYRFILAQVSIEGCKNFIMLLHSYTTGYNHKKTKSFKIISFACLFMCQSGRKLFSILEISICNAFQKYIVQWYVIIIEFIASGRSQYEVQFSEWHCNLFIIFSIVREVFVIADDTWTKRSIIEALKGNIKPPQIKEVNHYDAMISIITCY